MRDFVGFILEIQGFIILAFCDPLLNSTPGQVINLYRTSIILKMSKECMEAIQRKVHMTKSFISVIGSPGPRINQIHFITTKFFLEAVILELIIKIFHQIEHKNECYSHDILGIFDGLNKQNQDFIQKEYDSAIKRKTLFCDKIKKKNHEVEIDVAEPEKLREVLKANENRIKNYKYEGQLDKFNSSADDTFYHNILSRVDKLIK